MGLFECFQAASGVLDLTLPRVWLPRDFVGWTNIILNGWMVWDLGQMLFLFAIVIPVFGIAHCFQPCAFNQPWHCGICTATVFFVFNQYIQYSINILKNPPKVWRLVQADAKSTQTVSNLWFHLYLSRLIPHERWPIYILQVHLGHS